MTDPVLILFMLVDNCISCAHDNSSGDNSDDVTLSLPLNLNFTMAVDSKELSELKGKLLRKVESTRAKVEFKAGVHDDEFLWDESLQSDMPVLIEEALAAFVREGAKGPSARTLTSNAFDALSEVRVRRRPCAHDVRVSVRLARAPSLLGPRVRRGTAAARAVSPVGEPTSR